MSLDQLRRLRRSGKRPECVTVLIGTPAPFDDSPGHVVIDRDGMDLRPLIGLPVHVIDLHPDPDFTLRAISELQALGTTLLGAATETGQVGVSEEHELAVRRYRRSMCPTA